MDENLMVWVRPLAWAVAILLFIIGAYADDPTALWGWGFALLTAGFLLKHLPGMPSRGS